MKISSAMYFYSYEVYILEKENEFPYLTVPIKNKNNFLRKKLSSTFTVVEV